MASGISIIKESFWLSVQQLWSNKLRSGLSLLGVTIGIFSIIAILTAVDALKNDISSSINKLGDNILFVGKWPWSFSDSNYPWWDYVKRPEPSYDDYKKLASRLTKVEYASFTISPPYAKPAFRAEELSNVSVLGVTHEFVDVMQIEIDDGRSFSTSESNLGLPVAVVGGGVMEELRNLTNEPLGNEITVWGRKVKIIGGIKKEGQGGLLGMNNDKNIYVPYLFVNNIIQVDPWNASPEIQLRIADGVSMSDAEYEIMQHMRAIRKLRPKEIDDFAINKLSIVAQGFEGIFSSLNLVGLVIGSFALLVGGFGIANIMYVSVTERTNIIGIKKAMGARKNYILTEFLIESILLCLFGGTVGLLLVLLLAGPVTEASGMTFVLSIKNASIGVGISIFIGLVSGYLPARKAANLDPVEAIRSK